MPGAGLGGILNESKEQTASGTVNVRRVGRNA